MVASLIPFCSVCLFNCSLNYPKVMLLLTQTDRSRPSVAIYPAYSSYSYEYMHKICLGVEIRGSHSSKYSHAPHNDVSVNDGPHIGRWWEFLEPPDKLIVEENCLPEQIFNVDETSLLWKWMSERTFIHKEAKSMPGFKACVSTLYDVRTTTKSLNDTFLRKYPRR
jgi:hypothetical protein